MFESKYSGPDDQLTGDRRQHDGDVLWPAPTARSSLDARVMLPGSKSLVNRELVLSALASEPSRLRAPLHSRDSNNMVAALRALGARIDETDGDGAYGPDFTVTPGELVGSTTIDCGLAGTVMRFVPPVAALALGPTTFDADAAARGRPMDGVLDALRQIGADIDPTVRSLPFTVHGTGSLAGGDATIDASKSSQFVSALLLSAARFDDGILLRHSGDRLPSLPHIDMTIDALAERGVSASSPETAVWRVEPGPITGRDVTIEPDLSNAAPFLAAALVAGGSVTIPHWPAETTQVGAELATLLPEFGATVTRHENGDLTVTAGERIRGVDLDLSHAGELAPALVALAAFANGPSRFRGIGHIRHHETDRLAALATGLGELGGDVTEHDDGVAVRPRPLHGGIWRTYNDHRTATAGALIGLAVPGVEVVDIATTAKTLPQFSELWEALANSGSTDTARA
ncbi:3-phosphoshikimate 1-carboxyvinyltransferase [Microbacterium sp. MPKO10]|uniref:3-phosphoshikimate 1-carboxyvinyltransferase n=1 Tax=Microbacterium sp. MPKO10 TaxID=2989818 RepID=UPI00223625EA|nr:3-phosphoshikimate 1-carboxyvinyltransferase [Microbacterium sp. MPKO10]MCW4458434.1 3-phosphoshikimate 1-carboxyvinyltransferase [Microbacterium sp. MPKO10]